MKFKKFDWWNQTITSEIARGVINGNLVEADKLNSNQNLAFSNIDENINNSFPAL